MQKFLIPKNLEVSPLVENKPILIDYSHFIVDAIITYQRIDHRIPEEWVPLKYSELRKVIYKDEIKGILTILLKENIIETDNQYIVGEKSKWYKIAPKWVNNDLVFKQILTSKVSQKLKIKEKNLSPIKNKLRNLLKGIEINEDAKTIVDSINIKDGSRQSVWASIVRIQEGRWFCQEDNFGRLHTNISNLKREAKNYLTWKGNKLGSVDIKNAQLYFLGQVVQAYSYTRIYILYYIHTHLLTYSNQSYPMNPIFSFDTFLDAFLPPEVGVFVKIASKGKLYEFFMEKLNEVDRGKIKTDLLTCIFGKIRKKRTKIEKCLEEYFPAVYNVILELKSKNYEFLAQQLQLIEGDFVIETICRTLLDSYDIPIFTIHDCILTTEEHLETVKAVIKKEAEKFREPPTYG